MKARVLPGLDDDLVAFGRDVRNAAASRDASAAGALTEASRNRRLLQVLYALSQSKTGMIRSEVAAKIGCPQSGVCQAFVDARADRLVETIGKRQSEYGKSVDVYQLTGKGHGVLIRELSGRDCSTLFG